MKPFERFRATKFDHPQDMDIILAYLEDKGKINVSYKTIENLYYEYSDSVCCSWRVVDEESLEEFMEWLEEYEI
jgi:hypothetical protein